MNWPAVTSIIVALAFAFPIIGADDFKVHLKERTITPSEIVSAFSAPAESSYTLASGDEIFIEVWGRVELSGHHVIGPDGRITLPVAGILKITDLTREQAQKQIASSWSPYYTDLAVTVRVEKYSSYRIYVLGRVSSPGALQFESQPTLLEVLTRAGSLPVGGAGAEKAGLVRCAVFRGKEKIVWVDLRELLSRGDLALNIRLARNDLVYLPDADDQLIYVLGEVQHPGAFRLTADMSFMDAFSLAGGLSEDGNSTHIALIRPGSGARRDIALKDIVAGNRELNASLQEGDIIYVPRRGFAKFGYLMQKISPLSTFAILGKAVAP